MIPKYIKDWLRVIESMANENTYKLAWGRALIECIYYDKFAKENNVVAVQLTDVSRYMLKYYWNQTFFFNLKQGPTRVDKRVPLVVKHTNTLIEEYKKITESNIPVWFDKVEEDKRLRKELKKTIDKIANVLPNDVSWRFKNIDNEVIDLYEYDNKNRSKEVYFTYEAVDLIKEYAFIISKLLNYKWSQLLEKFNYAPKITCKVNSISETKLKRESLVKFKKELLKQFNDGIAIDFYSGEPLNNNDISVDHVIPWSFMYSDDIWNLVLTSKSHNSSKSNSIPSEDDIERLKERNKELVGMLGDKYNLELEDSINNNYVDKYYFECRM